MKGVCQHISALKRRKGLVLCCLVLCTVLYTRARRP